MNSGIVNQTEAGATPLDGFLIMMHSASSSRAAEIGRAQIERHYHRQLTAALRGRHAAQRAAAILSVVAGLQVMRQVIGLSALTGAKPAALVALLTPIFEKLVGPPE